MKILLFEVDVCFCAMGGRDLSFEATAHRRSPKQAKRRG